MSRILLVEDDKAFREILVEFLSRMGFEVKSFSNPKEALPLVSEFEIIHTDGSMPEMNGVEFTRAARAANPDAFICMYSGENSYEPEFREAGGDAFVNKLDFIKWRALLNTLKKESLEAA